MSKPKWLGPERYRVTAYKGDKLKVNEYGFAADENLHWLITDCLYSKCTKIVIKEMSKEEPK